jgi:hypothetical protein
MQLGVVVLMLVTFPDRGGWMMFAPEKVEPLGSGDSSGSTEQLRDPDQGIQQDAEASSFEF